MSAFCSRSCCISCRRRPTNLLYALSASASTASSAWSLASSPRASAKACGHPHAPRRAFRTANRTPAAGYSAHPARQFQTPRPGNLLAAPTQWRSHIGGHGRLEALTGRFEFLNLHFVVLLLLVGEQPLHGLARQRTGWTCAPVDNGGWREGWVGWGMVVAFVVVVVVGCGHEARANISCF